MHYLIGFSLGLMVIGNSIIKHAVKSVAHRKCHFTALIRLVLKEARWPERRGSDLLGSSRELYGTSYEPSFLP